MGGLKKARSGERLQIPAAAYNAFVDAAEAHRSRQTGISRTPQHTAQQTGIVLLRNDSAEDRLRFDVLGLAGPIPTPDENESEFQNRTCLSGVVPEIVKYRGRFGILLEPIPDGAMGRALVAGVSVAWVRFESATHAYADVCDSDATCLQSAAYGAARLLWKDTPDMDGYGWAVIHLGERGVPDLGVSDTTGAVTGHAEVLSFPGATATEIAPGVVRLDI